MVNDPATGVLSICPQIEVTCLIRPIPFPLRESYLAQNHPLLLLITFLPHPLSYKDLPFWTHPQSPLYLLDGMLPDS